MGQVISRGEKSPHPSEREAKMEKNQAVIMVCNNYGKDMFVTVDWDGTQEGKIKSRKQAFLVALKRGFTGDFISYEAFTNQEGERV
jgi:hypothetical protein